MRERQPFSVEPADATLKAHHASFISSVRSSSVNIISGATRPFYLRSISDFLFEEGLELQGKHKFHQDYNTPLAVTDMSGEKNSWM